MYGRRLVKLPFSKEKSGTSKEVELGKKIGTLGMLVSKSLKAAKKQARSEEDKLFRAVKKKK